MTAGVNIPTPAEPLAAPDPQGRPAAAHWLPAAGWFALLLAGQAASLQLVDAGTALHYQHYLPLERMADVARGLPPAILAAQFVLVLLGLRAAWGDVRSWVGQHFRGWQVLALVLVLVLVGATVSREVPRYLVELAVAAGVHGLQLATLALAVRSVPGPAVAAISRWWDEARVVRVGTVWVVAVTAGLNWAAYERHPHVPDEVVYLLHANYLAEGHLTLPPVPVPDAFDVDLMHYEADRWFCPVPPGWPAILTVGALAGVPWLVNPVLAGACVPLTFALMRRLYDESAARAGVVLLCVSPWFLFTGMSFMTHTATLAFALAAAVGVAKARETGRAAWGWAAGAALGVVGLIRPLDGVIVAAVLGLWAIGVGGTRLKWGGVVGLLAGAALVGATVLPYNRALTGSPTKFPINAYIDKYYAPGANDLGFGPNRGLGWGLDPYPGHGLRDVVVNTDLNLTAIDVELFGWGAGSLLFVGVLLVKGAVRRADLSMLAVVLTVVGAHAFYWFSGGPDFGARYWFLALVPCIALTVSGIRVLGGRAGLAAAGLSLAAVVCFIPWRAADKYYNYRAMPGDIPELASRHGFGRSLVLVRGNRHPDYASAVVYNPVDLAAPVPIYAWDVSDAVRAKLLAAYPDRPVWVVDGPTRSGGGFRVVAGPLPPGAGP